MKNILIVLVLLSFNLNAQVPSVTTNSKIKFVEGNNTFSRTVSDLLALVPGASPEVAIVNSRQALKDPAVMGTSSIAYVTNTNFQGFFYKATSGTPNDATIVEHDTVGSGTGVWVRYFEKEVDPKWWVGISGSDDAAAVLSAYNYCRTNLYNIGFSPNKTYTYGAGDSTVFPSVGRDIYINGNNATINVGATTAAWVFDNAQRIYIRDVRFVGNAGHNDPYTTTFPSASSEGTFMRFKGTNCGNIFIENCRFTQFGAYAIDILQTAGSTGYYKGINMEKCLFYDAPMDVNSYKQACIKASVNTEYNRFNKCIFEKVPRIYWGASNGANTWFNDCSAANTYAQQQRNNAQVGTVTISGGVIKHIALSSAGAGYETAPTVSITGDGTGATATATLAGGQITRINVTSGGTGYTTATVTLTTNFGEVVGLYYLEHREKTPLATAVLSGDAISGIFVNYPGVGYDGVPTVVITPALGGAAATANMMNDGSGRVQSITVTNPGSGYSTPPVITFTGSSASSNFGKFQLEGGKYNHIEDGSSGKSNLGGSPLVVALGVIPAVPENREVIMTGVEALVVGNNNGTNNSSTVVICKNSYLQINGGKIQATGNNSPVVRLVNVDSAMFSSVSFLNGTYGIEAKDCAGIRIDFQTVWLNGQSTAPYNFVGTTTVFKAWLDNVYVDNANFGGNGTQGSPITFAGVVTDPSLAGLGTNVNPLRVAPRDYEPHNFPLADRTVTWELGSKDNLLGFSWVVPAALDGQYLESIDWYVTEPGDGIGAVNIPKIQIIDPSYDPDTRVGRVVLANTRRQVSSTVCWEMTAGAMINFYMDSVQTTGVPPKGLGANVVFSPTQCIPGDGNLVPTPEYAAVLHQMTVYTGGPSGLPTYSEQYGQNLKMQQIIADSFFYKLDAIYILTRGSKQAARVNWLDPGVGDLAYTNESNITWTNGIGLVNTITGDQTGTYATMYNPNGSHSGSMPGGTTSRYAAANSTIGIVTGSDPVSENGRMFSNSALPRTRMVSANSSAHIFNNNSEPLGSFNLDDAGFKAFSRQGNETNVVRVYKNGSLLGSVTTTNAPTLPVNLRLWGDTTPGFTGEVRAVFIGRGLTASEISKLYTILSSNL